MSERHRHDWYTHERNTPCYGVDGEIYIEPGVIHCRRCFKVKPGQGLRSRLVGDQRIWAKVR